MINQKNPFKVHCELHQATVSVAFFVGIAFASIGVMRQPRWGRRFFDTDHRSET
jgi:hypothetical protein